MGALRASEQVTDGEPGVGTRFRDVFEQSGQRVEIDAEIVELRPPELLTLLQRHAADEARHYEWACAALEELGCGTETATGRAVQAFAQFHGASADILEAVGRNTMEAAARAFKSA